MPILRIIPAVLLLSATLLCAGCYGGRETEDVAYVLAMGIDLTDDGQYKVTYQIAVPRTGGGEGGGKGEKGGGTWVTNTVIAATPSETRMLLNSVMSRFSNLGHVSACIFGEKMARSGLGEVVAYLTRNRDFRETMIMLVVEGTAEDYIRRNNPKLETNIAKFYETVFTTVANGYYMRTDLHDFYTGLKCEGLSAFTAYSGINPKNGGNLPAGPQTPQQTEQPYLPGGLPLSGSENQAEFLGLALFRGDKLAGLLDSDETRAVYILRGKGLRAYLGVVDPLDPKNFVNIAIRLGAKPKIKADLHDGAPIFNVAVFIEGEILGIPSGINYETGENRGKLEQQISGLLEGQIRRMLQHTQTLGCDPVGFGMYLRPQFSDYDAMKQADFAALYRAADIRVKVTTKIRRTGLHWQTTPPAQKSEEAAE